jgi:hypothetical protein
MSAQELSESIVKWMARAWGLLLLGALGSCTSGKSYPTAAAAPARPVSASPTKGAVLPPQEPCEASPDAAPRLRLIDCVERRDFPFLQPTEPCDPELAWALDVDDWANDGPWIYGLYPGQAGRVTFACGLGRSSTEGPWSVPMRQRLWFSTLDASGRVTASRFLGSPTVTWGLLATADPGAQPMLTRPLHAPQPPVLPGATPEPPPLLALVDSEGTIERFVPDPFPPIEFPSRELALSIASDRPHGAYAMRVSQSGRADSEPARPTSERLELSYVPLSSDGVAQPVASVELLPRDRPTQLHAFVVPESGRVAVVGTFSGRFGVPLRIESTQSLFVARWERGGRLLEATQYGPAEIRVNSVVGLGRSGSTRLAVAGSFRGSFTFAARRLTARSDCTRAGCAHQPTAFLGVIGDTSWARTFPELFSVRIVPGPDAGLTALGVVAGGGGRARVTVLDSSGKPRWQREFSRLQVHAAAWTDDGRLLLLVYDLHRRTTTLLAFQPALDPDR